MDPHIEVKHEQEGEFMPELDSKSSKFFQELQQSAKRPSSEGHHHHVFGQGYDLPSRPLQSTQSTEALNLFGPPSPTNSINSFFNSHSFAGNPILYNDFGFPVWENLEMLVPQIGEQAPQQQAQPPQPHLRRRVSISNGHIGQIVQANSYIYQHKHQEKGDGEDEQPAQPDQPEQPEPAPELQTSQPAGAPDEKPKPDSPELEVNEDGVPKVRLLYNNEVIFDPEKPIPGTAQWKRQKLLERNKLAAAKCRQKKKVIQKQLQQDVDHYKSEADELRRELEQLRLAEELLLRAQAECGKRGLDEGVFSEILAYKRR